jgi:23S rRNA-/tRNA-specific pseudouridylate synthase
VHLQFLGFPIVGDKIYGDEGRAYLEFLAEGWTDDLCERLRLDRQALHARRMEFEWDGELVVVRSPLPDELRSFCIA